MNKKAWIAISVVVVLALMGGSFYGGMLFQRYQFTQQRANFAGGNFPGGNFQGGPANGNPPDAGAGGAGGGLGGTLTGQVKSLDGKTLSLSTARNVTTITLDDSTRVQTAADGTVSDLVTGQRVIIIGQRDSSGNMTASQVIIIAQP